MYKVYITLHGDYQIDFANSGEFGNLLGYDKKVLKFSGYGDKLPNISNIIDNLFIKCSLLSESIVSGACSSVIFTVTTSTKTRGLPFELNPRHLLWNKINTTSIREVTFEIIDDLGREVDLNGVDITLTVVLKSN